MSDDIEIHHRRMGERKIQQWADSALLRLMQHVVTVALVPLVAWGGSKVLDRLDSIDKALARSETSAATVELRLQRLEEGAIARESALRRLSDQTLAHEIELKRLTTVEAVRRNPHQR